MAAEKFVKQCVRRILGGENPAEVFSCGLPGRPNSAESGAKLKRARAVQSLMENGKKQHVAIATVAKDFCKARKTIRGDLQFAEERANFDKMLGELDEDWNAG